MKYLTENTLKRIISEEVDRLLQEEANVSQNEAQEALEFIKSALPGLQYPPDRLIDDLVKHGNTIKMIIDKGPDPRTAGLSNLPLSSFRDLAKVVMGYKEKYLSVLKRIERYAESGFDISALEQKASVVSPNVMQKVFDDMNIRMTTKTPPTDDVTAPMKKAIAASWEAYVGTDPTKKKIRDLWVALTDETLNEGLTKQGYDSSFKSWVKWYKSTVESDPSIKFLSPEQVADKLEDMFEKGTEAIRNKIQKGTGPWDSEGPSSSRTVVSKMEESVYSRWQKLIKG